MVWCDKSENYCHRCDGSGRVDRWLESQNTHTVDCPECNPEMIKIPKELLEEILIDLKSGMFCNPSVDTVEQLEELLK